LDAAGGAPLLLLLLRSQSPRSCLQNWSLVLTSDVKRDAHEPTGELETLAGRNLHKMGGRVQRTRPEALTERKGAQQVGQQMTGRRGAPRWKQGLAGSHLVRTCRVHRLFGDVVF
jgi:hypothetical protein